MKTSVEKNEESAFRAEIVVSAILARGVFISLALMLAGTVLAFMRDGAYGPGGGSHADLARLLSADGRFTLSLPWLWHGLTEFRGVPVIVLGLLMLIATPVLRVLVSMIVFIIGGDRRYTLITLAVFVLLVVSFLLGKIE